jgi:dolichol kinase
MRLSATFNIIGRRQMAISKADPTGSEYVATSRPEQISMKSEFMRKSIHLCSIAIPIIYIWTTRRTALWLLVPMTLFALAVELLRPRIPAVELIVRKLFGSILRTHEKQESGKIKLSGATWVLLSATLCVLIFPKVVTIAAFTTLIVSDTMAALLGRRFGRHKFLEKSVEGSTAFFVFAVLVVFAVAAIYSAQIGDAYWSFILAGTAAALVSTVAEAMSYGVNVDDNLTIPFSFGGVMWGLLAMMHAPEIAQVLAVG